MTDSYCPSRVNAETQESGLPLKIKTIGELYRKEKRSEVTL